MFTLSGIAAVHKQSGVDLEVTSWHNSRVRRKSDQETSHMAIEAHLAELEKKHRALEQELEDALAHPSSDDIEIAELKRRKLQVKDEIARLRHDADSVH